MIYLAILFLESTPHKTYTKPPVLTLYIESTLEALRLQCRSQCRTEWCGIFGNTFSEIYASQNLYIESILNAMRLLVSEIDRNTLEMAAILKNGVHNVG